MELRSYSPSIGLRCLQIVALLVIAATLVRAQTVRWQPDRGTLGIGQTAELQLVFEDCSPDGTPTLPAVPGLSLELVGQSQSWETINLTMTRKVVLNYMARATQRGTVRIPAFEVKSDKGAQRVRAAEFQVGDATVGQSGTSLDSIVQSRLNLPGTGVWAGEVFPLTYTLSIARRFSAQLASNVEWTSTPLAAEEWAKPEMAEVVSGGENHTIVTYRARAMAKAAGQTALKSAQQLVNLQTGTAAFGLFARPTMEQFTITTPPVTLNVKPLPVPAPAAFAGAVGEFTLTSKVVPTSASVGEPITWTLELAGTGNWPDITTLPSRQVSRDFRVVQPQAKRTTKEGFLFEGSLTEDVVLIASKPGTYTLGPVRWSYFDPKAGEYRTLTTEAFTVTISPAAAPPAPVATASTSSGVTPPSGNPSPSPSTTPPPVPGMPRPIPRDPLPGSDREWAPISDLVFWTGTGSSFVALATFWLVLAWRRARITDPLKPQREARERLLAALSKAPGSVAAAERNPVLTAFRKETVTLLSLPQSTPSTAQVQRHAQAASADAQTWAVLWEEAERALYGADGHLPGDWNTRAEAAVRHFPLRRLSRFSFLRLRNLAPFFACLLIASNLVASAQGAEASVDYRAGRFTDAERVWRERVVAEPTDWIARHNLALTLGQQDRWGEAAGHATSAFVQRPTDPAVLWNLAFTLQRAGFSPAEIAPFLGSNPVYQVARILSPTWWTLMLMIAVWLLALALGLHLYRTYHPGAVHLRTLAHLIATAAVILGTLAFASRYLYHTLADPHVAMVWRTAVLRSIPTEAAANQKSSPLAAGLVGIVDKDFLGWRRLKFVNGQTGWVHAADLVPLWQAPSRPLATPDKSTDHRDRLPKPAAQKTGTL